MISSLLLSLFACSEFTVHKSPDPPVAQPPGDERDEWGEPPDWSSCTQRYDGRYTNLPGNHPDLLGADGDSGDTGAPRLSPAPADPSELDWWDATYLAFRREEATLDQGGDWWPVDEGLEGDPQGWAGRWLAWLRIESGGSHRFVLGASTDAWLLVDGEVLARIDSAPRFEPATVELSLEAGQRRLELRTAQRGGESGLSFRPIGEDLAICVGEPGD